MQRRDEAAIARKYDVTRISKLGLMEIARQRIKGEKMGASYATCPSCEGYGWIKNVEPAALSALRKLQTRSARGGLAAIRIGVPPEVATWILNNKREELLRVERRNELTLEVMPRLGMRRHETEFEVAAREKSDAVVPHEPVEPRSEPVVAAAPARPPAPVAAPPPAPPPVAAAPLAPALPPHRPAAAERPLPPIEPADFDDEDDAIDDGPDVAAASEAEPASAAGPADGSASASGEPGGRRRRRRRRRRRGRGRPGPLPANGESGSPLPAEASAPVADVDQRPRSDDAVHEPIVPTGVRSDELMPAASGGGGRRSSGRGRGRRRRGGGPPGHGMAPASGQP